MEHWSKAIKARMTVGDESARGSGSWTEVPREAIERDPALQDLRRAAERLATRE